MKNFITFLIIILSFSASSQSYKGLSGYLKVEDGVWTYSFQNNNYKVITDISSIVLTSKLDVEIFYNDLQSASKDIVSIVRKNYSITSNKKMVTITNIEGGYSIGVKKYLKFGLKDIKESINFM